MTEYKGIEKVRGHRSLYFGLLFNILLGCLMAVAIYCVIYFPSQYLIGEYFVTPQKQRERRESYMQSLDYYMQSHAIGIENVNMVERWVKNNPYVYVAIYRRGNVTQTSYSPEYLKPNDMVLMHSFPGARTNESQRAASGSPNNYYKMVLHDGEIIVALDEYDENLYYSALTVVSTVSAILTFIVVLVRYIGVIIGRVKRFEGDVTIVSEIDMNYEIVSEGKDEIANLSTKVDKMRRNMLDHIKNEQEAREANTELITSISHDIRTPLTVLMGYIEMMKEHAADDDIMKGYIEATENTALRLKHLSDDMFKYSLAFGDTKKSIKLEEYDFLMLLDQIFTEHFVLMRENGYDIRVIRSGETVVEGTTVMTDAPNLMRIVDNVMSNMRKYADKDYPIMFKMYFNGSNMVLESRNKIRTNTDGAESNGIGLKTCVRLGSLVANKFEYKKDGEIFICRLVLSLNLPNEKSE